ncbi:hypothetical protein [Herbiconiux sp. A18JL235]|uniref:Uncharacterized protein n=1 Tax=Herbiconiux sp. A18JL235 TaxID=3152363 RepID=A0AB39BG07_9MICO
MHAPLAGTLVAKEGQPVKRINILYAGKQYSVSGRDIDEVKEEIRAAVESAVPTWLEVNVGEGKYKRADILISPGVDVAVVGIDADE